MGLDRDGRWPLRLWLSAYAEGPEDGELTRVNRPLSSSVLFRGRPITAALRMCASVKDCPTPAR